MSTRLTSSLYIDPTDLAPRFELATLPDLPPQVILPGEIRMSASFSAEDQAAAEWFHQLAAVAEQAAAWHTARTGGAL
ncbi:hypothetical protein Franean1_0277 [Parafrankia sp. EAN1pec]|uniref:hypothetical protein n=1 Tax=Parafrankia sp. (strain EAN1pec) TaxID=298653 RepID=UPI00005427A0|nr:hypothetical protein Franean1_0277 [Frankia sp. EAN1pec]